MPTLLRSTFEKRCMRKYALMMMHLANVAAAAGVPAAAYFYFSCATVLSAMALGPSRRWAPLASDNQSTHVKVRQT